MTCRANTHASETRTNSALNTIDAEIDAVLNALCRHPSVDLIARHRELVALRKVLV